MTKRILHISVLFVACGLLWTCSHRVLPPTSVQIDEAVKTEPGTNPDILQMGFEVYADKCGNCHKLHQPGEYDQAKWEKDILPMMSKKAKLTDQEYTQVKAYIFAFSKDKQIK